MDQIEALIDRPVDCGNHDNLYIFVNGERLDLLLSAESGLDLRGFTPGWLFFSNTMAGAEGLKRLIIERSDLDRGDQIMPILLSSDDYGSFGPTVIVDVHPVGDQVLWQHFGLDSAESPTKIGEKVQWLDDLGPFNFNLHQYLDCLKSFIGRQPSPVPTGLIPRPKQSLFSWIFTMFGALSGIGTGFLNLPALAYRQVQHELIESPTPPEWSFSRLLPASGLLAMGLDHTEQHLMVIKQNWRELFNLNNGRREARAEGRQVSGQDENAEAEGIGPLAGQLISLWGPLGRQTSPDLLREARLISNGLSAIKAVLSADEGRQLIVAQEDGIYIFKSLSTTERPDVN